MVSFWQAVAAVETQRGRHRSVRSRVRQVRRRLQNAAPIAAIELLEDRTLLATLDPLSIPKFVNPLPLPAVLTPTIVNGVERYEIAATQFQQDLGLGLKNSDGSAALTTVWGYAGSYPGPTIEARTGQPVEVLWTNELVDTSGNPLPHLLPVDTTIHWANPPGWPESGVPIVTHLHGGHTESESDGLPDAWFTPAFGDVGPLWAKATYHYDNDQEAATLWYHDHALGLTRLNVYAGLAGFYLLRDDREESLDLPSGAYELPIVIQDRMFTDDGQLFYPSDSMFPRAPEPSALPTFFGDVILVNGKAWPVTDVEPRKYRLRLLNGSDSRFYTLRFGPGSAPLSGPQFIQIGTDGGLLSAPLPLDEITIGPGERFDVIVDFSAFAGQTLILRNNAPTPFPQGANVDPLTTGQIMAFRVSSTPVVDDSQIPVSLRSAPFTVSDETIRTRKLGLFAGRDEFGRPKPLLGTINDGGLKWGDPVTENPRLDDVEIWEIYNATGNTHPIHLHLVMFEVLSRQRFNGNSDPMRGLSNITLIGSPMDVDPSEAGPKDTILIGPGEVVRVRMKFDRPGEYVWHCHILSHEDHEMMRPIHVLAETYAPIVDFNGDGLEDIAEMTNNGEWWVGLSNGAGQFATKRWATWAPDWAWAHIAFGDLDGDGFTDIVGLDKWGKWWVGRSNAEDRFESGAAWADWADGSNFAHVAVGDFDSNGDADVAAMDLWGNWWVGLSNGADVFETGQPWAEWAAADAWSEITLGDFDGEGTTDLAGLDLWGNWWVALSQRSPDTELPQKEFSTALWTRWAEASRWATIDVGDFNDDGADDVAGMDLSGNWWASLSNARLPSDPSDTFAGGAKWADWADAIYWFGARVGDFNHDGLSDIAGFDQSENWWVGLSNGSNTFETGPLWANWPSAGSWAQIEIANYGDSGAADVSAMDQDGRWRVGLSNEANEFVGDDFWADWNAASEWATLDDDLTIEKRLDRLMFA